MAFKEDLKPGSASYRTYLNRFKRLSEEEPEKLPQISKLFSQSDYPFLILFNEFLESIPSEKKESDNENDLKIRMTNFIIYVRIVIGNID